MFTPTSSFQPSPHNSLYFRGKDKQNDTTTGQNKQNASTSALEQPDALFLQDSQSVTLPESKGTSTLLDKMLSSWGFKSQPAEKRVKFQNLDDLSPPSTPNAKSTASAQNTAWINSLSRFQLPGLRVTAPPGTRIKKKNTHLTASTLPADSSGSALSNARPHSQEGQNKVKLASIKENDGESILQYSLPDLGVPLDQLLTPPPQLPAALENLAMFADRGSKTPASSLWVEDTTGLHSRISSSCPPSRSQEQQEETDEYSDAETESLCSNSSSAFWVDDDLEVQKEREGRASRKWAKAVKNQKLGSLIAQQITKPDIHQNTRYLEGDSDLDSIDQAFYYDSDDGLSDSDSDKSSIKSVKHAPVASAESLLTKTIRDPKFQLVTQHQQITRESNARISNAIVTQSNAQAEHRIRELQQIYSLEQLASNYQKLQIRLSQIEAHKASFINRMKVPPNLTLTDQVMIWHNILHNLNFETMQQLEHLDSTDQKGKRTEQEASLQRKALLAKKQTIEVKQQQVDSAVGLYNDLEANELQIRNRLALYHEAIARTKHQSLMNILAKASEDGQKNELKMQYWQELGRSYSSGALRQVKSQLMAQEHTGPSMRKLQILDHALKFQETMAINISTRLKKEAENASQTKNLAQQLSNEFTKVELREAYHLLSRQQDSNLPHGQRILNLALAMASQNKAPAAIADD